MFSKEIRKRSSKRWRKIAFGACLCARLTLMGSFYYQICLQKHFSRKPKLLQLETFASQNFCKSMFDGLKASRRASPLITDLRTTPDRHQYNTQKRGGGRHRCRGVTTLGSLEVKSIFNPKGFQSKSSEFQKFWVPKVSSSKSFEFQSFWVLTRPTTNDCAWFFCMMFLNNGLCLHTVCTVCSTNQNLQAALSAQSALQNKTYKQDFGALLKPHKQTIGSAILRCLPQLLTMVLTVSSTSWTSVYCMAKEGH